MKILLVNTSDRTGGAAIAAERLLGALVSAGADASMVVRDRTGDNPRVSQLGPKALIRLKFLLERGELFLRGKCSRDNLFAIDQARLGTDITRLRAFREADVVHLHWVNQAMLSLCDIRRVLRSGKPVVWTFHDMWPMTGVCHQADQCTHWLEGCGRCPMLAGGGGPDDLSAQTWRRKRQCYGAGPFTIVTCSNWLASLARRSPLLRGHEVVSIPNAINTDFFSPRDKVEARRRLRLPLEKKLLLFVAYRVTEPRKGVDYLQEALAHLQRVSPELAAQLGLVAAGREATQLSERLPVDVYPQNYVTGEDVMRDLYCAADALLMPTLMDNLPNTIVEAMACGTPCVGFNVGGLPQMIDHGKNGYLSAYKDAEDFARGIGAVVFSDRYKELCQGAREKAERNYSARAVAQRYLEVYERVLRS